MMPSDLPISIPQLFHLLPGTYTLSRTLTSSNPTEPSGTCTGTATFTPINHHQQSPEPPGPTPNTTQAVSPTSPPASTTQLLYSESGTFHLSPTLPEMQFRKSYLWQLEPPASASSLDSTTPSGKMSTYFIKPNTESAADYLFHDFSFDQENSISDGDGSGAQYTLHATASHLCVKDMYDTEYWFVIDRDGNGEAGLELRRWKMKHIVKGPNKDQVIESLFEGEREDGVLI